jgi:hypothetical protein
MPETGGMEAETAAASLYNVIASIGFGPEPVL